MPNVLQVSAPDSTLVGLDVRSSSNLTDDEMNYFAQAELADVAPLEAWSIRGTNKQLAYSTHGAFRYFGKFPPPVASYLIREHTGAGDLVLDPMCGSGTTGVEALLAGRRAVLGDVSPLSLLLARVKTTPVDLHAYDLAVARVVSAYRPLTISDYQYAPVGLRDEGRHWFLPATTDSLRGLRLLIEAEPNDDIRDALRVAFASSVRRVSRATTQQGRLFLDAATALPDALSTFVDRATRLRKGLSSIVGIAATVAVRHMDMRNMRTPELSALTVLHPPYFNAYRYSSVNSLELSWLGFPHAQVRKSEVREFFKVGRVERLPEYIEDMRAVLENAAASTAPNGVVAVMIGDTLLGGQHVPVVRRLLETNVARLDLESVALRVPRFTEATWVASQRRTGRALGVRLMDYVLRFRVRHH